MAVFNRLFLVMFHVAYSGQDAFKTVRDICKATTRITGLKQLETSVKRQRV